MCCVRLPLQSWESGQTNPWHWKYGERTQRLGEGFWFFYHHILVPDLGAGYTSVLTLRKFIPCYPYNLAPFLTVCSKNSTLKQVTYMQLVIQMLAWTRMFLYVTITIKNSNPAVIVRHKCKMQSCRTETDPLLWSAPHRREGKGRTEQELCAACRASRTGSPWCVPHWEAAAAGPGTVFSPQDPPATLARSKLPWLLPYNYPGNEPPPLSRFKITWVWNFQYPIQDYPAICLEKIIKPSLKKKKEYGIRGAVIFNLGQKEVFASKLSVPYLTGPQSHDPYWLTHAHTQLHYCPRKSSFPKIEHFPLKKHVFCWH